MVNLRMCRFLKIWLMIALLIPAGAGNLFASGGGGGGDSAGSSYSGWSSDEITAAFGFQGGASGGTINIGESPPPSKGSHQGTQWTGFNQIPSGLPQFTKREWAEGRVAVGTEEAKQQLEKAEAAKQNENIAKGVSIGCSLINGILSFGAASLGQEAVKQVTIYGLSYDGLTSAAGAYAESHLKGDSAAKSLAKAGTQGAAKVFVSFILGKAGPGTPGTDAAVSTVGGILYDEAAGGGADAPNTAPAPPVTHAPMATPTTVNTTGIHM